MGGSSSSVAEPTCGNSSCLDDIIQSYYLEREEMMAEWESNGTRNETWRNGSCETIQERLSHDWLHHRGVITLIGIVYTLIFVVGLFGNCVVVSAVLKFKALQTVRNMFIFGLSCSDFLSLSFSVTTTPIIAIQKTWYLGKFACHLFPLIQGMCLCFSTFTLVSIAVDRYILIVHPHRPPITRQIALRILLFNCSLAFILSLPVSINQDLIEYKKDNICGKFCTDVMDGKWRVIYASTFALFAYFIPLFLISFSYLYIVHVLMERAYKKAASTRIYDKSESSHLLKMAAKKATAISRESIVITRQRRTNRMLMSMVVVFGLCWLPYVLNYTILDLAIPENSTLAVQGNFFTLLVHCIAVSTTMWNPLIYAFLNEQFREAFKQVLGVCFKKKDGRTVFRHRSLLLRRDSSHNTMRFNEFFASQTSRFVSSMVSTEGHIRVERLSSLGKLTTPPRHPAASEVHFAESKL